MRITNAHSARLTASGRHVEEIIRNVIDTSLRRISSDSFSDSCNFSAIFLPFFGILKPFCLKLSLTINDLDKWLQR